MKLLALAFACCLMLLGAQAFLVPSPASSALSRARAMRLEAVKDAKSPEEFDQVRAYPAPVGSSVQARGHSPQGQGRVGGHVRAEKREKAKLEGPLRWPAVPWGRQAHRVQQAKQLLVPAAGTAVIPHGRSTAPTVPRPWLVLRHRARRTPSPRRASLTPKT